MLRRTYRVAKAVEYLVEGMIEGYENVSRTDVNVYPWLNGREKGLCFKVSLVEEGIYDSIAIFVSEHRNSDQIGVTIGKSEDWSLITDEEYKNRKFFNYNQHFEAARFILQTLEAALVTVNKKNETKI